MQRVTSPALRALALPRTAAAERVVARRSIEKEKEQATAQGGTYFFAGKTYTPEEWEKAQASGELTQLESVAPDYQRENGAPEFTELMKFDGIVPERNNGRLAMIAVIAAIAAELSSGKSVLSQLSIEPTLITLTFVIISAASLIPPSRNVDENQSEGIFTPKAEVINGRAAMLGFASLLVIEAIKGGALFG